MENKVYLSWDVGIVNLAYCIIEKTGNETFKILDWQLINLGSESMYCCELNKNKSACTNKATLTGGGKHYCKIHSKNYVPKNADVINCDDKDKDIQCSHTMKDKLCEKKATVRINDNLFCKTHGTQMSNKINKDMTIKKIGKTNSNKIPINALAAKLFCELDKNAKMLEVNEVLIENQPTLKNPTMKTMSSLLFAYFIIRGIIDTETENKNKKIGNVRFISPSNKLKVKNADNTGKDYKKTKDLGKTYCKELISKNKDTEKYVEFINSQKKQDDLCDAFLQGYYYIFCKK